MLLIVALILLLFKVYFVMYLPLYYLEHCNGGPKEVVKVFAFTIAGNVGVVYFITVAGGSILMPAKLTTKHVHAQHTTIANRKHNYTHQCAVHN